ncbi:MAG TPA: hypothetical protein VFH11_05090 [Gemmatimonadota bacterium]|nr:hypothetical protein [Gemmatimonadota bacterium]
MTKESREQPNGTTVDPLIEAYKKDVDRASIRQNLRRTAEERILNLQSLHRFATELRRAGRTLRAR